VRPTRIGAEPGSESAGATAGLGAGAWAARADGHELVNRSRTVREPE